MDKENYKMHLNSLIEAIIDEEKLVTYVSISKDFCIHINASKDLMNKAVEFIRAKIPNTTLNIIYLCSGLTSDNKACTYLCPESELIDYRKKFKILFFEHIYSVNKGHPSVDKVALMAVTKFEDYYLCSGLIKGNVCAKRTKDEIDNLKTNSMVMVTDQKPNKAPAKPVKNEKTCHTIANGHDDPKKVPEVKSEASIKQEKTSPIKDLASSHKQKTDAKKPSKPQKGIAGFFSRSDSASAKTNKIKDRESEVVKHEVGHTQNKIKDEKMDVDDNDGKSNESKETKTIKKENKVADASKKGKESNGTAENKMDVDDNDGKANEPKETKTIKKENKVADASKKGKESNGTAKNKSKSNKSSTDIKKNSKVDKKRKRVYQISDSESDTEKDDPFVDEDEIKEEDVIMDSDDEIIPPTPNANVIKITSGTSNPRKRRKIVNKTYTDEDGYILTKKEEVYESMSESEDPVDTKENIQTLVKTSSGNPSKDKSELVKIEISPKKKSNTRKGKKISPKNGKQATLMSFFKKA